jgi:hypothetical protein
MTSTRQSTRARLDTISPTLLRHACIGGLLGGTGLFLVMAGYNAANTMGFWALVNTCFAAFVFKSAGMTPMPHMPGEAGMGHEMMGGQHIVASPSSSAPCCTWPCQSLPASPSPSCSPC